MIDIPNQRIIRGKNSETIIRWEVYMMTPFGIAETIDEALVICQNRDLDPYLTVVPVPVAFSLTMQEIYYK